MPVLRPRLDDDAGERNLLPDSREDAVSDIAAHDLPRTYVCPACGYDGYRSGGVKFSGLTDVNMQVGCPVCKTLRGLTVWLVETSDPRTVG